MITDAEIKDLFVDNREASNLFRKLIPGVHVIYRHELDFLDGSLCRVLTDFIPGKKIPFCKTVSADYTIPAIEVCPDRVQEVILQAMTDVCRSILLSYVDYGDNCRIFFFETPVPTIEVTRAAAGTLTVRVWQILGMAACNKEGKDA